MLFSIPCMLLNGTLKTYKGFPHGMPTTEAATINADLLAGQRASLDARARLCPDCEASKTTLPIRLDRPFSPPAAARCGYSGAFQPCGKVLRASSSLTQPALVPSSPSFP